MQLLSVTMFTILTIIAGVLALATTTAVAVRFTRRDDPAWVRLTLAGCGVVLAIGGVAGVGLGLKGDTLEPPALAVLALVFGTVAVVSNRDSREQ